MFYIGSKTASDFLQEATVPRAEANRFPLTREVPFPLRPSNRVSVANGTSGPFRNMAREMRLR